MPDPKGYTRLWRKTWDNDFLMPRGHEFTRMEAWLYLINHEARGTDDSEAGLKRGEFAASIRQLSKEWLWSKSQTERFLADLINKNMIKKLGQSLGQSAGHLLGHFSICNYETYNGTVGQSLGQSAGQKVGHPKEGLKKEKEGERTTLAPSPSDSKPLYPLSFPLNDGTEYRPTAELVDTWKALYQAVDVDQVLRNICGWDLANKSKRKTRNGIERHITTWLMNEQNRGGSGGNSKRLGSSPAQSRSEQSRQAAANWLRSHGEKIDGTEGPEKVYDVPPGDCRTTEA